MMEKQGVVDSNTPPEKGTGCGSGCRRGHCGQSRHTPIETKQAADQAEGHLTTRLAEEAEDAFKRS